MKDDLNSKLVWDEFLWYWSQDNDDLTHEQLSRQSHLFGKLDDIDGAKYARVWDVGNKVRRSLKA